MYARRKFAVRNVRFFTRLYHWLEWCLLALNPVLEKIGHKRLDKPFLLVEKSHQGFVVGLEKLWPMHCWFDRLVLPDELPKDFA